MGRGALMAKMDIKQAYRNIPIFPQDRLLLGVMWNRDVYVDEVLPFGLRSAPILFSAVADVLQPRLLLARHPSLALKAGQPSHRPQT